jgi:pimeloyl-ACP methyl ester carboxylesterase
VRVGLRVAAVLMCLTVMSGNAQAAGHVYLLKGLLGIFSTGLITLADELQKRGYTATVHDSGEYDTLASEAARLQKSGKGPIIIVGHSLGANAAISMAEKMKDEGASVALIVGFGPTNDMLVPSNVSRVINYYQTGAIVSGTAKKGPGFHGSIANINLGSDSDINHFNIEKIERLHAKVISAVGSVAGRSHTSSVRDANLAAASVPSASARPQ